MSTFAVGGSNEIHIFEGFNDILTLKLDERVSDIVFLSDSLLASAGTKCIIKIWNFKTGECLKELNGHKRDIYSLHFKPPYTLFSASLDKTLRIWNILDWSSKTIEFQSGLRKIYELDRIYLMNQKNTVFSFDIETSETKELIHFDQYVYSLGGIKNGIKNQYLVCGDGIFICEGSKIIKSIMGHDSITKICFFPCGDMVGISDKQMIIWDKKDLIPKYTVKNQKTQHSIEVINDDLFVTGDWYHNLYFWSENGKLQKEIRLNLMEYIDVIRVLKISKIFMDDFLRKEPDFNIHFNFN